MGVLFQFDVKVNRHAKVNGTHDYDQCNHPSITIKNNYGEPYDQNNNSGNVHPDQERKLAINFVQFCIRDHNQFEFIEDNDIN
jgi:hypothetical protein